MNLPKVSVITPSFNQGKFIEKTIKSVLNQSYPSLEYIVIDGKSSDNTVDILKKYGEKIRWVSESDNGQTNALNKGIKMAKGSIIGWLNSDDMYLPDTVQQVIDYFISHPGIYAIYGDINYIDEQDNLIRHVTSEEFDVQALIHRKFNYTMSPGSFYKKEIFEKIGFFDESLSYVMDLEMFIRIGNNFEIAYLPSTLANFRFSSISKTSNQFLYFQLEAIKVCRNYGATFFSPILTKRLLQICTELIRKILKRPWPFYDRFLRRRKVYNEEN